MGMTLSPMTNPDHCVRGDLGARAHAELLQRHQPLRQQARARPSRRLEFHKGAPHPARWCFTCSGTLCAPFGALELYNCHAAHLRLGALVP